jgi:tetratricopeptide (TPR) repeat protein
MSQPAVDDRGTEIAPPESGPGRSSLLDRAYQEYCRREEEEGQAPDPVAFCGAYPTIQSSLARVLSVHRFTREDPTLLAGTPVRWPEAGESFLGFELQRLLGQGGFSRVFLASQPALGHRQAVIKVSRFGAAEAQTLGRLTHPNIVPVYSVTADDATGLSAVCMPYLGEATLCDVLDRVLAGPGLPRRAATILEAAGAGRGDRTTTPVAMPAGGDPFPGQGRYEEGVRHLAGRLLDALAYLHGEGVSHRDLKPSNVLLTCDGVPMLLDFNLSGDTRRGDARLGGTPVYMAPEQLRLMESDDDPSALDGRSDLFSLGVILYELLTGKHPFAPPPPGTPPAEVCRCLLERQPAGVRPLRHLNPAVDRGLARLVQRCLAFDPADRPGSAAEARALLGPGPGRARRLGRSVASRPRSVLALLLALALAAAAPAMVPPGWAPWRSDWERSQQAYDEGDYPRAVEHLTRHLEAHPDDARGWRARAAAYQQLAEPQGSAEYFGMAAADLRQADQLAPDGRTEACLGYVLQRQRKDREALPCYEKALGAGFVTPEVLNNLGCLQPTTQPDRAERCFSEALQLNPALQPAYHNRAMVYLRRVVQFAGASPRKGPGPAAAGPRETWLEKGIGDIEQAIRLGPVSGELYHNAAKLYAYRAAAPGPWADRAIEYLDLALRHGLDPGALKRHPLLGALGDHPEFPPLLARPHTPHPSAAATHVLAIHLD